MEYRTPDRASRIRRAPTRRRILQAAADVAAAHGFHNLSVARIIERAGISRSTFYEHFPDRDVCFRATLDSLGDTLIERLEEVESSDPPSPGPLVEAICEFVGEHPRASRVLFSESLAAGRESLEFREGLQRRTAVLVALASRVEPSDAPSVLDDLVGGLFRLFAMRLSRNPGGEHELCPADLAAWVSSYAGALDIPSREPLGQTERVEVEPTEAFGLKPLQADRRRLDRTQPNLDQRLRIYAAVARLSHRSGYEEVTVTDITAAAKVSRSTFYRHFRGKPEAANQALELIFQQVMGACTGAFSSASRWPDGIWNAARAFADFFIAFTDYAHVGLVETHVVGEETTDLVYDRIGAFGLLLEEGYRWRPGADELPRISSEAVGATMHEIAFGALRERRPRAWYAALLPQFVFICLAPFMGPEAALEFVQAKALEATAV